MKRFTTSEPTRVHGQFAMESKMTGWEMLYEAFRHYPSRPESAIAADFIAWLPAVSSVH